jgi:hypothetical protein
MITSRDLLDTSIAQLETLVRFLGEQLREGREGSERDAAETRACRETLRSLSVLILKLKAAGQGSGGNIDLSVIVDSNDDAALAHRADRRLMNSYPRGLRLNRCQIGAPRR